jgi:microcystin-dependent protein
MNTAIQVRVSILDGSSSGAVLGSYTYQKTTDTRGQFTVAIGTDATIANSGAALSAINWTAASRFIKVEYQPGTSGGFTLVSNSEATANFYAFAAKTSADGNPSGAIIAFGGISAPSGWLLCDGSAVSRTTYSNLFTAIGTAFGSGDGSTTFNLPDFRGRFMRGLDGTANNDPDKASRSASNIGGNSGNNVGSLQGESFKNHQHSLTYQTGAGNGNNITSSAGFYNGTGTGGQSLGNTDNTGGNETRPKNVYVNYIIKY